VDKSLHSVPQYANYFYLLGLALTEALKHNEEICNVMIEQIFGNLPVVNFAARTDSFKIHETFPVTKPGEFTVEFKQADLKSSETGKRGWALLGCPGGNELFGRLILPTLKVFPELFKKVFLDLHSLPESVNLLSMFPHLAELILFDGSVTKIKRDTYYEIMIDGKWHPKLRETYRAVYDLILRIDKCDFHVWLGDELKDKSKNKSSAVHFVVSKSKFEYRYCVDFDGYTLSFDDRELTENPKRIDFNPANDITFFLDCDLLSLRLKELGCGVLAAPTMRLRVSYEGHAAKKLEEGSCDIKIRIVEFGSFPFETLIRPFFNCDGVRQLLLDRFLWHLSQRKDERNIWIITTDLILAMPKCSSLLISCARGFFRDQFENLDLLMLFRDIFLKIGLDLRDAQATREKMKKK